MAMASPAASQPQTDAASMWSWVKNKASIVSDSVVANSGTIFTVTKEGTFNTSNYLSGSYAGALDNSKVLLLWTKEKISKISEITACDIASSNSLRAVMFHSTLISLYYGLSISSSAAILTSATVYATSRGICYFQYDPIDQLIDGAKVDITATVNSKLGMFKHSALKAITPA